MRNKKLMIAIPTTQYCCLETYASIYRQKIPNGMSAEIHFTKFYGVAEARNWLVKQAIEQKFDYILFIDSDIVLPDEDTIEKLIAHNLPIVGGWYIKKVPGQRIPEVFVPNKDGNLVNATEMSENQLMKVGALGFGCVLINTGILRVMEYPYFTYEMTKDNICSEDIIFCQKLTAKGIDIFVDTSIYCGHIGEVVFK